MLLLAIALYCVLFLMLNELIYYLILKLSHMYHRNTWRCGKFRMKCGSRSSARAIKNGTKWFLMKRCVCAAFAFVDNCQKRANVLQRFQELMESFTAHMKRKVIHHIKEDPLKKIPLIRDNPDIDFQIDLVCAFKP